MSNLAIIPMRMGSKRLPRKNVRDFFGKPIFVYTLEAARRSGLFDEILVSTESEEVRDLCREHGLDLPFMRPDELAGDKTQLVQVVRHVLDEYDARERRFEAFCLLWATAPLRTETHIRDAYAKLDGDTEAVIGVTDYDMPPLCAMNYAPDGFVTPMFEEYMRKASCDMPRLVVDNGTMCWVRYDAFRRHDSWLPPRMRGYWMPRWVSVDVDEEEDWALLEYYYRKYFQGR